MRLTTLPTNAHDAEGMISKTLRFEVFKRDSFKCRYCGRAAPEVVLNLEHVVPVARGGLDEIANFVTACADCNGGKSDCPLDGTPEIQKKAGGQVWLESHRAKTARLATIEMLLETMVPVFFSPPPSRDTLRSWLDDAKVPRFKANPLAKRGGGPAYYSVSHVEKLFRNRTI